MKFTRHFLSALLCFPIMAWAQLPPPGGYEDKGVGGEGEEEVQRCGQERSVVDCHEFLEFDQNTSRVFHRKTGKPFTGRCESCHENGNREHLASFKDGKEDGVSKSWYPDGSKHTVRSFTMGTENGDWMYWYEAKNGEEGKLAWHIQYLNGKEHGKCQWFFPDGSEKKVENYSEGLLDGLATKYYEPGVIKSEINYKRGELDGEYKMYFPDGKIMIERTYKMGRQDGINKQYYDNGQIAAEGEFRNGDKIGKWMYFYRNGVDKKVEYYTSTGKKTGIWQEYYEDGGKLKHEQYFNKDELVVKEMFWDEFGNMVDAHGHKLSPEEAEALENKEVDLGNEDEKKWWQFWKRKKKDKEEKEEEDKNDPNFTPRG